MVSVGTHNKSNRETWLEETLKNIFIVSNSGCCCWKIEYKPVCKH